MARRLSNYLNESLTPPRPAPKVVSYPSLAPDQVEKAPYRSPFDSPTI